MIFMHANSQTILLTEVLQEEFFDFGEGLVCAKLKKKFCLTDLTDFNNILIEIYFSAKA